MFRIWCMAILISGALTHTAFGEIVISDERVPGAVGSVQSVLLVLSLDTRQLKMAEGERLVVEGLDIPIEIVDGAGRLVSLTLAPAGGLGELSNNPILSVSDDGQSGRLQLGTESGSRTFGYGLYCVAVIHLEVPVAAQETEVCVGFPSQPTLTVAGQVLECAGHEGTVRTLPYPIEFRRGEINSDGVVSDISDAIGILLHLFSSTPPELACEDAADINDDSTVDISDAISLLDYFFVGAAPPSRPFSECDVDPSDDSLDCNSFDACQGPSACTRSDFEIQQAEDELTVRPVSGLELLRGGAVAEIAEGTRAVLAMRFSTRAQAGLLLRFSATLNGIGADFYMNPICCGNPTNTWVSLCSGESNLKSFHIETTHLERGVHCLRLEAEIRDTETGRGRIGDFSVGIDLEVLPPEEIRVQRYDGGVTLDEARDWLEGPVTSALNGVQMLATLEDPLPVLVCQSGRFGESHAWNYFPAAEFLVPTLARLAPDLGVQLSDFALEVADCTAAWALSDRGLPAYLLSFSGLLADTFEQTGDRRYLDALRRIVARASFAANDNVAPELSILREVSWLALAATHLARLSNTTEDWRRARRWRDYNLQNLRNYVRADDLAVSGRNGYSSFFVAIATLAAAESWRLDRNERHPQTLILVRDALERVWQDNFEDGVVVSQAEEAPTLLGLFARVFGWYAHETGDLTWVERVVEIWPHGRTSYIGGNPEITGAGGKQLAQNLWWIVAMHWLATPNVSE